MRHDYDLIVLGTGPSAGHVAMACAKVSWSVAIVDAREVGGTCALRGCNPKKVLTRIAELKDWLRRASGQLSDSENVAIDWPALIEFKRTFTDPVRESAIEKFRKSGIDVFEEPARFIDPQTVAIGERHCSARFFVIATGARPRPLKFTGAENLITSDQFLELDSLPSRVLFTGGGYVSCEFAHVARCAGAQVTILQQRPRLLNGFEPDLVDLLTGEMRQLGMQVELNCQVSAVRQHQDGSFEVRAGQNGEERGFQTDLVVHGAGRIPHVVELNLPAANVETAEQGVQVNGWLQSVSNPHVYAVGDVADTGQPKLTPVAALEGKIVAQNLLEGTQQVPEYGAVPRVAFAVPPLAAIGLTEEEAQQEQLRYKVQAGDMTEWGSNRKQGKPVAGYKILIDQETDKILGAHLLGPDAADAINLFAMAMRFGQTAEEMKSVLFAFPTSGSDVRAML